MLLSRLSAFRIVTSKLKPGQYEYLTPNTVSSTCCECRSGARYRLLLRKRKK